LKLKCTKFDFGWGSAQTLLGKLTALPYVPYLDLRGPTLEEREGGEKERAQEGRGGAKGEGQKEGREMRPLN